MKDRGSPPLPKSARKIPKSARKIPKSARITAQGTNRDSYLQRIANFAS